MFHLLLESNATPQPRIGGSMLSTAAHVVVVAGAIALTTTHRAPAAPIPLTRQTYIPVKPVDPVVHTNHNPSTAPSTSTASTNSQLPTLSIPDIHVGIPPIDLNRAVTGDDDFARGSRTAGTVGGAPGGVGSGPSDGSPFMEHQVDKPVFMAPGAPTPAYPDMLRNAGIAGGVMVEFVVDTLGRVEQGSAHVLQSDHDQFSAAVRSVLPRLRFIPAEAQGRKVRQLVRLPFRFDLNH